MVYTILSLSHPGTLAVSYPPVSTVAARGLDWRNLVRVSLIFAIIISFMLFTVFPLVYLLYFLFRRISDSRFMWIHDLTESVGPVPFSAQYLICRPVRTDGQTDGQIDGQTDELIRVGLGNLRFLQLQVFYLW